MNISNQQTTRRIVMRRLFKQDLESAINCYKKYDRLYYNPVCENFLCDVLLNGEIWGAYTDSKLIACCYFFPLESDFFKTTETYTLLADFVPCPQKYMYMGYIGTDFRHFCEEEKQFFKDELSNPNGLYTAFLNIVQMQTFRKGLKYILHSIPLKMSCGITPLFAADYNLIKLRGLDNLVVHYIFAKAVFPCENIYNTDDEPPCVTIKTNDTKKVSALLESGYCAVNLFDNSFTFKKLITD